MSFLMDCFSHGQKSPIVCLLIDRKEIGTNVGFSSFVW
jgi:hypothetical protein